MNKIKNSIKCYKDGKDLAIEYLRRSKKEKTTQEVRIATGCNGVNRHLQSLFKEGKISRHGKGKWGYKWKITK